MLYKPEATPSQLKKYSILIVLALVFIGIYLAFFHKETSVTQKLEYIMDSSTLQVFKKSLKMNDSRLISFLRRNITKPITKSSKTPVLKQNRPDFDWSQQEESKIADEILKRRRNGFYVEFRASDGETYSNTLYFELKRNWTGLLVEADPYFFQSLIKKKRNAYAFNGCLSQSRMSGTFTYALQSLIGGHNVTYASNERRVIQNIDGAKKLFVPCVPLYSLMLALNRKSIDFFSLDAEGSELNILKTIPFKKLSIDLIAVQFILSGGTGEQQNRKLKDLKDFFRKVGGYNNGTVYKGNIFFKKLFTLKSRRIANFTVASKL